MEASFSRDIVEDTNSNEVLSLTICDSTEKEMETSLANKKVEEPNSNDVSPSKNCDIGKDTEKMTPCRIDNVDDDKKTGWFAL